jgi:hypothetical protein
MKRFEFDTPERLAAIRAQRQERAKQEAERRAAMPEHHRRYEDWSKYLREEVISADRVEHRVGGFWDRHAFLVRYGSAAEIDQHGYTVGSLLAWLTRGTHASSADLRAIEMLEAVLDRIRDLFDVADAVEAQLRADGWEFDPVTRTMKELRTPGPDGKKKRGRRRELVSEAIGEVYFALTEGQGWQATNTAELREEIRSHLADTFGPDVLTDTRIHSVVNSILNENRHHRP